MFLEYLSKKGDDINADDVADAFEEMIGTLKNLMIEYGIIQPAYLNMIFTDGERMVGLRYVTDPKEKPLTLYYSEGSKYICEEGVCQMMPPQKGENSVMIVSEKLTDLVEDWREIPANYMVLVYKDLSVKLRKVLV